LNKENPKFNAKLLEAVGISACTNYNFKGSDSSIATNHVAVDNVVQKLVKLVSSKELLTCHSKPVS
jgi:hypothetical protein